MRCNRLDSTAESCSEPCTSTTTGILPSPGGSTSLPTSFVPLLSNVVSLVANGIRSPDVPSNTMSPRAQSENEIAFPSGRSVQPKVLDQVPFGPGCSLPVSPLNNVQRNVPPSEGPMSRVLPSCRW